MLFPADPSRRPELWSALADQFDRQPVVILISAGVSNLSASQKVLSSIDAKSLIQRMKEDAVARISSSRGAAYSPHFSGASKGRTVDIRELIALSSSGADVVNPADIRNAIETLATNLLFAGGEFDSVRLPLELEEWETEDLVAQMKAGALLISRRRT